MSDKMTREDLAAWAKACTEREGMLYDQPTAEIGEAVFSLLLSEAAATVRVSDLEAKLAETLACMSARGPGTDPFCGVCLSCLRAEVAEAVRQRSGAETKLAELRPRVDVLESEAGALTVERDELKAFVATHSGVILVKDPDREAAEARAEAAEAKLVTECVAGRNRGRSIHRLHQELEATERDLASCRAAADRIDRSWRDRLAAAEFHEKALREALGSFISIAAAVRRAAAERWDRARLLQDQLAEAETQGRAALAAGREGSRPPLAPPGCGEIGPKGLRCTAHISDQHISYVYKAQPSDEVADRWPLAAGKEPA